jgi:hypothetical protein
LGSGIRKKPIPDPGVKKAPDPGSATLENWAKFFLQHIKNKIISIFVKFVATKNGLTKKFFSPLSIDAVIGSGIRDG